ncbi:hypothetical protein [Paraburkholderia strydomiana]|uniref:hypothetical protein n=1 Tax=Paraburkholderia strydomiana TaxID=1245417 RepID=UPI0020351F8C|nr:hypothetical protein [Paraburkholderia strydomiana]
MLKFSTQRTITTSGAALPRSPSGEPALVLRSIRGEEALSAIYTYVLDMVTPDSLDMLADDAANLDLRDMISNELTVSIQLEGISRSSGAERRHQHSGEAKYHADGQPDRDHREGGSGDQRRR